MSNTILSLVLHNTKSELQTAHKTSKNPIEKTRLHFLWMVRNTKEEESELELLPEEGAKRCGMSADWARRIIRAYNAGGLDALTDKRTNNKRPALVSYEKQEKLKEEIKSGISSDGGLWTGPKVAKYLGELTGKKVSAVTGWKYLVSLGFSLKTPRLAHEKRATPEEQKAFKKNSASSTGKQSSKIPEKPSKSGQKMKHE